MAVLKALENCISKEKFKEKMKQFGWNVNWTEKRKHITFQNQDGKKEFPIVKDTASDITTPRLYNIKSTPKLLISKIGACFHI